MQDVRGAGRARAVAVACVCVFGVLRAMMATFHEGLSRTSPEHVRIRDQTMLVCRDHKANKIVGCWLVRNGVKFSGGGLSAIFKRLYSR